MQLTSHSVVHSIFTGFRLPRWLFFAILKTLVLCHFQSLYHFCGIITNEHILSVKHNSQVYLNTDVMLWVFCDYRVIYSWLFLSVIHLRHFCDCHPPFLFTRLFVWGLSGWLTTLLQCFDTVGWVIRPVKTVGRITYIVLDRWCRR